MSLLHKVALVTGGVAGIGRAVTELFLQNGAKVAMLDTDYVEGVKVLRHLQEKYTRDQVIFIPCDVSCAPVFNGAFDVVHRHFNRLDIVVNNAGIADESKWEQLLRINMEGVVRGTKLAFKYMSKEDGAGDGGVIINIASLAAIIPQHMTSVYSAAKSGVLGYSRALGCEAMYKKTGVRVNACCPSFTETGMTRDVKRYSGMQYEKEIVNDYFNRTMMSPQVIAKGILELVSDETKNGAAMLITNSRGPEYLDFSEFGRRASKL